MQTPTDTVAPCTRHKVDASRVQPTTDTVAPCTRRKRVVSGGADGHGIEMGPDRLLDEYAARQFGVISLSQARLAGITDRMVDRRVESGAWIRLASGVYALGSAPPSWERQLAAAILSRPEAVVAGRSAAYLHRLDGFGPGRPVVMVPIDGNARSPIARVVRSRYFHDLERVRVRGFSVSGPAETLVTLAGELTGARLEALVDDVLASGLVDGEGLMSTIEARPGARGISNLRRITADRLSDAYQPPTSSLEHLLYALLSRPGIPAVTRQSPFPVETIPMTVDAYIPAWALIVEADGRRWHTRKADFERDRLRDNLAISRGIAVLRFTYSMLNHDPDHCLATILDTGKTRSRAS